MARRTFRAPARRRYVYGGLLAVLGYVSVLAASGADPAARGFLLQLWAMAAMGVCAVAVPHLLLPDRDLRLLLHLNPAPSALLRHQLRQWLPVVGVLLATGVVLAFWDPGRWEDALAGKALRWLEASAAVLGVAVVAFGQYARIGPVSQQWQEHKRGGWYRAVRDETGYGFAAPEGMVPALMATPRIFVVGLLALAAARYVADVLPALAWVPGLVVLIGAGGHLLLRARRFDRAFYATNAFYSEVFAGGVRTVEKRAVPYASLYWVPARWRPPVWAGLRQLDRRLPLGRFVALGLAVLGLLFYLDVAARQVQAYLALLILAKNAAVGLLVTAALAPPAFQLGLLPLRGWIVTRWLANLRWTPPLLATFVLIAWLDPSAFGLLDAGFWIAFDVLAALLAAVFFTLAHEARYHRRLA